MSKRFYFYNLSVDTQNNASFHDKGLDHKFEVLASALQEMTSADAFNSLDLNQYVPIFVVPEYFFERYHPSSESDAGGDRYYNVNEKNEILFFLKRLSDDYPSVLIVPGTIAWKHPIVGETGEAVVDEPICGETASGPFWEGGAPVAHWREGTRLAEDEFRDLKSAQGWIDNDIDDMWNVYRKERPCVVSLNALDAFAESNSSFHHYRDRNHDPLQLKIWDTRNKITTSITGQTNPELFKSSNAFGWNEVYFYYGGHIVGRTAKQTDFQEGLANPDVIAVNGINPIVRIDDLEIIIGLEVCFDHNPQNHMLRRYFEENHGANVDLHLVLSACIPTSPESVMLDRTTYLLHSSSYYEFNFPKEHAGLGEGRGLIAQSFTVDGEMVGYHYYGFLQELENCLEFKELVSAAKQSAVARRSRRSSAGKSGSRASSSARVAVSGSSTTFGRPARKGAASSGRGAVSVGSVSSESDSNEGTGGYSPS